MIKYRWLKVLLLIAAVFFAAFILMHIVLALMPFPELDAFKQRSYGLLVQDRNGLTLRVIPPEDGVKREWVSLDQIPAGVRRIFIRAEDRRFYLHPGIAASAWRNFRAGEIVSGASTITMQLARIIKPHPPGMKGKLIEAWDALRLEAKLSKQEILGLWFNGIPFGSNIEGIGAMARTRFGLTVNQLDDVHAAVLAVVPRRPSLYDPLYNEGASFEAAALLARRCNLHIDEEILTAIISGIKHISDKDRAPFHAPHFTTRLAAMIQDDQSQRIIKSTLDANIQAFAEHQLENELLQLSGNRVGTGAILLIENATGNILAYVGSKSWFDEETQGKIDGVQVLNQPGSCLKPFLYAMAMDAGIGPNDILPDLPSVFGGSEGYIPSNFDRRFNGPVRMRIALASSLNIPAVYTLERLGVSRFERYLEQLGFYSITEKMGTHGTGLALGNAEISLEELVTAFAAFPRGGIPAKLRFYESGEDENEKTAEHDTVMSPETAWIICDILSDKASRYPGFGPAPVFQLPFPVMFKTGTSNQFQNIWALAATQQYTVGVWMGNFSGETVVGATGSSIPARIAANILSQLVSALPSSYNKPSHSAHVGGTVPAGLVERDICALSGMLVTPDCVGSVREWFPAHEIPGMCTWHNHSGVVYPPEYQSWIVERFRSAGTERNQSVGIRIPVSGSVFYIDPSYPASAQAARIETYGFEPGSAIFVDGILSGVLNNAGVFMLPLAKGQHLIEAEDELGNYAAVEIEVR